MSERDLIVFLCVANSARSQMAEGLARTMAPPGVAVASAGSSPAVVHPMAQEVMAELGIDLSHHRSKGIPELELDRVAAVVTLCAEEVCPVVPGAVLTHHWPHPDPAAADEASLRDSFREVRDALQLRLREAFEAGTLGTPSAPAWHAEVRAAGAARLAVAKERLGHHEARSEGEPPAWPDAPDYPFAWGTCWKACMQVEVEDLAAELGFFADRLGFKPFAIWPDHVMLASPDDAYHLTLGQAASGQGARLGSLSLQMMLGNMDEACASLRERGVPFVQTPRADPDSGGMRTAVVASPGGMHVKLWALPNS